MNARNHENDEEIFNAEAEQDSSSVLEESPRDVRTFTADASAQLSLPDSAMNSPFHWSPSPLIDSAVNLSGAIAFSQSSGLSIDSPVNSPNVIAFNLEEAANAEVDEHSDEYTLPQIFPDLLQMKKMSSDRPLFGDAHPVPYSTNALELSKLIKEYAEEISEVRAEPEKILKATARVRKTLATLDSRMKGQQKDLETAILRMKRNLLSIESKTEESDGLLDELLRQNKANEHNFDKMVELLKATEAEKKRLEKENTEMKSRLARINEGANNM